MKRGILIIAVGHENYKLMAANLAAGIKYNEPGMQIALATDTPPPAWLYTKKLVDMIIHVPEDYYTTAGKREYIKVKTRMYDLSPFEHTIFLDADMLWLHGRVPSVMFEQLKELDWTMANTGVAGSSVWADINEVKKVYKTTDKPYYNFHSEFVYFRKCAAVKKYFNKVKEIYEKPKVKGTSFGGARIADELAFQIASMVLDYYPHKDHFLPTNWFGRDPKGIDKHKHLYELSSTFYGYSIGGKIVPDYVAKKYNDMASFYFKKLGLPKPWFVKNKVTFIPERNNI